jgi:hypothetical protein
MPRQAALPPTLAPRLKTKNARSLDTIADNIHKLERGNIIDTGDLLLEAKAQCEHGQWLDWVLREFPWSAGTAERYMRVAELSAKFCTLQNLKLSITTLYQLADHECEEDLPAIIKELAKHATQLRLAPRDAERVIKIGIARHRFGDHPDATLFRLGELLYWHSGEPWHEKAVAALQQHQPETDESACLIVNEVRDGQAAAEHKAKEAERKADEKRLRYLDGDDDEDEDEDEEEVKDEEAESILDGASPDLPPPEATVPKKPGAVATSAKVDDGVLVHSALMNLVHALGTTEPETVAAYVWPDEVRELRDEVETIRNWLDRFIALLPKDSKAQHADEAKAEAL